MNQAKLFAQIRGLDRVLFRAIPQLLYPEVVEQAFTGLKFW